jgi:hypothetical protein
MGNTLHLQYQYQEVNALCLLWESYMKQGLCVQATEFYDVKPWSLCSNVPAA